jgi:hypothetical protein
LRPVLGSSSTWCNGKANASPWDEPDNALLPPPLPRGCAGAPRRICRSHRLEMIAAT